MPLKSIREIDDAMRRRFLNRLSSRLLVRAFGYREDGQLEAATAHSAAAGFADAFTFSLGRVTQKDAATDLLALRNEARAWREAVEKRKGWQLEEKSLSLRALRATVSIPKTVSVAADEDLISALSPAGLTVSDWTEAISRLQRIAERFLPTPTFEEANTLTRAAKSTSVLWRKALPDSDFERLLLLIDWLRQHPNAGCFIREIPLEGIDSKWFERHRRALCALWNALFSTSIEPTDFAEAMGLRSPPNYVRVRHASTWFGDSQPNGYDAARDALMVPLDLLARRAPESDVVLIVENEQTGLSISVPNSLPVLIGMGYGVTALETVPWLAAKRILYFGDLDTHGLAILAECRRRFPQTESVLMNLSRPLIAFTRSQ